jgi:hypothetical protein
MSKLLQVSGFNSDLIKIQAHQEWQWLTSVLSHFGVIITGSLFTKPE